ncbi:MAG TPA: tetratricopeptide repeat protein [Tepidisphaeraceae bacterium]|jgi:predicted O-linked N-acetylglucosamine transferase (SPINDLY family)|nr:tetratricopeptide repeat protein [Tepidisphaeraceae bacterium]
MPQISVDNAIALARQHCQAARFAEASRILDEILAENSNQFDALHLLGLIALQAKDYDRAHALIARAIQANPAVAAAHYHLGNTLVAQGDPRAAEHAYRRAIALDPSLIEAFLNLGDALARQEKLDDAIRVYSQALARRPENADILTNIGNALKRQGRLDEAVIAHRRAVAIRPNFAKGIYNLANGLREQGKFDEAINGYRRAIQLEPDLMEPYNNLGNLLKDRGFLDEALACYDQAIRLAPADPGRHSNRLYAMLFHPAFSAADLYDAHREYNRRHSEPLRRFIQAHGNNRDSQRRLRIGYISSNFCDHVVGRNVLPLLREHDRGGFEIHCYADELKNDLFTATFRSYADKWRNVAGLTDERVAAAVREDRIDILVDLTLHLSNNRLMVFARKPAPVQVTFAGYPGGAGLDAIDYRLSDPRLDPPGAADRFYAEKTIRLPETFWCYDEVAMMMGLNAEPRIGPAPALANGFITFGCLNNFCKINSRVIAAWARVLGAVGNARLILLAWEGDHRRVTLERFASHGIDPGRIEFVLNRRREEYLIYYHRIDIGLDTLPYNGHTTSLDSYWMGVPVVTHVGQTAVGRAGLSQLTNLGLPELAAASEDEFVAIARDLAGDLTRLSALRQGLRERMRRSPLMDARRFAKNIESAYRDIWRRWCTGG